MAPHGRLGTVYAAAVTQGVALVTFPAASTVFTGTGAGDYGLSTTEYGALFGPQAVLAILAALLGAGLARRLGNRRLYLIGLAANLASMALLVASRFVMHRHAQAYGTLLVATACLGMGFGLTVPALNTFTAAFRPDAIDKAVLALNALLGLGTALAPIFITLFVGLGYWWGLPALVGTLLLGLLVIGLARPLDAGARIGSAPSSVLPSATDRNARPGLPPRFWIFAAYALLYGVCETMAGNWGSLYMENHFGASAALASLALTVFWATVTAGRVLFAALGRWLPEFRVCRILPFGLALALVACACLPRTVPGAGLLAFALAGLGCSALLPFVISSGQSELATIGASVAGGLIAFYQVGYGIAAFGVGPLQAWTGLDLGAVYGAAAAAALGLAALAWRLTGPEAKSPGKTLFRSNPT